MDLRCLLGFHDYGEPHIMKVATLSGKRHDGLWEHEFNPPTDDDRYIAKFCPRCNKSKTIIENPTEAELERYRRT